ncbi:hypothetical protein BH20GEM1_BH20GEM1_03870 [soil metagenome]
MTSPICCVLSLGILSLAACATAGSGAASGEAARDSLNVALDAGTRIFDGRCASVSPDQFSLVRESGTPVDVIADMEPADIGTALEVRAKTDD